VGDYFDIIAPKNYWVYIAGDYEGIDFGHYVRFFQSVLPL